MGEEYEQRHLQQVVKLLCNASPMSVVAKDKRSMTPLDYARREKLCCETEYVLEKAQKQADRISLLREELDGSARKVHSFESFRPAAESLLKEKLRKSKVNRAGLLSHHRTSPNDALRVFRGRSTSPNNAVWSENDILNALDSRPLLQRDHSVSSDGFGRALDAASI
eukprot:150007_1